MAKRRKKRPTKTQAIKGVVAATGLNPTQAAAFVQSVIGKVRKDLISRRRARPPLGGR